VAQVANVLFVQPPHAHMESSSTTSVRLQRQLLLAVAFVLFVGNLAYQYPGWWVPDAQASYADAVSGHYRDWQPPVTAWIWSLMRHIIDGTRGMLILQLALEWTGFWLVADALLLAHRPRTAWLTLLCGAFPVFLFYNGMILKDVELGAAFVCAFGLAFHSRIVRRPIRPQTLALIVLLLVYGTLVRANAIFALGPLLIYLLPQSARALGILKQLALTVLIAAIALPLSSFVNHQVLGAEDQKPIESLQLFDLNGIAHHTQDLSVLPPESGLTEADLHRCYTPFWWDTLAPWGTCHEAWERLGAADSPARQRITRRWVTQIGSHPVAYLEHRLEAFNSMMYFLVPAKHCRYVPECGASFTKEGERYFPPVTPNSIRFDYIKKNFATWPATWLVLGLLLLRFSRHLQDPQTKYAARALLLSGLSYMLSLFFIGVATEVRYVYWGIMAILLAALICLQEAHRAFSWRNRQSVLAVALLVAVIAMGLIARLADFRGLLG
jgi:hypothetical protein